MMEICVHLIFSKTCSMISLFIFKLRDSSSGIIFHPVLPMVDFLTLNVTSFFIIGIGVSTLGFIFKRFLCIHYIKIDVKIFFTFSLACLKLLAFLRDLLKLLILFSIGSCLTLESRGESEGTGVLFLTSSAGEGGGVCGRLLIVKSSGVKGNAGVTLGSLELNIYY